MTSFDNVDQIVENLKRMILDWPQREDITIEVSQQLIHSGDFKKNMDLSKTDVLWCCVNKSKCAQDYKRRGGNGGNITHFVALKDIKLIWYNGDSFYNFFTKNNIWDPTLIHGQLFPLLLSKLNASGYDGIAYKHNKPNHENEIALYKPHTLINPVFSFPLKCM